MPELYRSAICLVFCINLNKTSTFESIPYHVQQTEKLGCENIEKILMGSGLIDASQECKEKKSVSQFEAQELASKFGMQYFEFDPLQNPESFETIRSSIAKTCLRKLEINPMIYH